MSLKHQTCIFLSGRYDLNTSNYRQYITEIVEKIKKQLIYITIVNTNFKVCYVCVLGLNWLCTLRQIQRWSQVISNTFNHQNKYNILFLRHFTRFLSYIGVTCIYNKLIMHFILERVWWESDDWWLYIQNIYFISTISYEHWRQELDSFYLTYRSLIYKSWCTHLTRYLFKTYGR